MKKAGASYGARRRGPAVRFVVWESGIDNDSRHRDRWYWHALARNGKIVAGGTEGFSTAAKAVRSIKNLCHLVAAVEFEPVIEVQK